MEKTILRTKDIVLRRVTLPTDNGDALVYCLYIREDSKKHDLYVEFAKELDFEYHSTEEFNGITWNKGINYDYYFKFV